ncbi:hypothetical protein Dip518_000067 [Parelusimicrobium proximum]|uniref:hypothetical protein n=1 Tax=Parelusimicrobium proximum TaxID=3228953 RepID=UPI003D16EEB2
MTDKLEIHDLLNEKKPLPVKIVSAIAGVCALIGICAALYFIISPDWAVDWRIYYGLIVNIVMLAGAGYMFFGRDREKVIVAFGIYCLPAFITFILNIVLKEGVGSIILQVIFVAVLSAFKSSRSYLLSKEEREKILKEKLGVSEEDKAADEPNKKVEENYAGKDTNTQNS